MQKHSVFHGQRSAAFPAKRIERTARREQQCAEQRCFGVLCAARFKYLMKTHKLKSLGHFKFFAGAGQLVIGQHDRFFFGEMKDDPLAPQFRISARQTQLVIE